METSRVIFGKIAEFLYELFFKSFNRAVQNKVDLDSDDKYSDEESKVFKDQTPFPDDIYTKKLDVFTFSYLLTQKVDFLQFLIQNLYNFTESTSDENEKLKAVRLILFFISQFLIIFGLGSRFIKK